MYRWDIIGTLKHSKIKTKILLENVYERILFRSTTKIMCLSKSLSEYSRAVTPQIRQAGNRLSGLAETAYASLLA